MPIVAPSQVVALIDRAYPWAAQGNEQVVLERQNAPTVGAIVSLVDNLPSGVLSVLSVEDYTLFLAAMSALKTSLPMWEVPQQWAQQHRLGPRSELNNRHPVSVIRSALAGCPDESPAMAATDLTFLADQDFEAALRLDISTATSALANGEFKGAAVIAGSVIEAFLLWALRRKQAADHANGWNAWRQTRQAAGQQAPRALQADILRWELEEYIEVARHIPIISSDTASAVALAKSFRNLIHPGRAERLQQRPTLASATLAVGAMRHLIDDLKSRVLAGTL